MTLEIALTLLVIALTLVAFIREWAAPDVLALSILCLVVALGLVNPRPFIIAVTVAASTAFALPMGYQTHMMVYGPGGYRFSDFLRVGIPLDLICWVTSCLLIPLIWPF